MPIDERVFAEVVRLTRAGRPVPEIAGALGVHRDTVFAYRRRARSAGVDLHHPPEAPRASAAAVGGASMDWRHRALCRDEDPELFFPVGTTGPAERQVEEAKAVCRRCAVMSDCLTWALETGQDAGVWGGTSEDERRALKRTQTRDRARTS
jgi:WhiB family redox-sensing transcriptional regulator